jgi:hypothetical protein
MCKVSGDSIQTSSRLQEPVVKLVLAMRVIRETNIMYTELIESLPSFQELAILVGIKLVKIG